MADEYVDTWRVETGPDDPHVSVQKNGEMVRRFPVDTHLDDRYERFKQALAWVEHQATYGDELIAHFSGSI